MTLAVAWARFLPQRFASAEAFPAGKPAGGGSGVGFVPVAAGASGLTRKRGAGLPCETSAGCLAGFSFRGSG